MAGAHRARSEARGPARGWSLSLHAPTRVPQYAPVEVASTTTDLVTAARGLEPQRSDRFPASHLLRPRRPREDIAPPPPRPSTPPRYRGEPPHRHPTTPRHLGGWWTRGVRLRDGGLQGVTGEVPPRLIDGASFVDRQSVV